MNGENPANLPVRRAGPSFCIVDFSLRQLSQLAETCFPHYFVEISRVEGTAVLYIAKDEIEKSTPERIEMTRKRIVKPAALVSPVGLDRALKIGNDQPDSTTGFQHSEVFLEQQIRLIWITVLEHVAWSKSSQRSCRKMEDHF